MKKVAIFSDLHLEFGPMEKPSIDADIVVLAGDIYTKNRAINVEDAQEFFGCENIIMILGNHEFYGSRVDRVIEKTRIAAAKKGIRLIENESIVINGVKLLGCTLWSDFKLFAGDDDNLVKDHANKCVGDRQYGGAQMSDFSKIRIGFEYRRFRPLDAATMFRQSVNWLDGEMSISHDGPTVVITHHAPSIRCVHPSQLDDIRTCAYASNLDWLIEKHQPAMWIHGHLHEIVPSFSIGKTKIVSNPRGYFPSHLNPKFKKDLVIDVV